MIGSEAGKGWGERSLKNHVDTRHPVGIVSLVLTDTNQQTPTPTDMKITDVQTLIALARLTAVAADAAEKAAERAHRDANLAREAAQLAGDAMAAALAAHHAAAANA